MNMRTLKQEPGAAHKYICARDLMTKRIWTVHPDDDVCDAANLLLDKRISCAPVIDRDKGFLGVFSERSCLSFLVTGSYNRLPSTHVSGFMEANPPTITEKTDILAVADIFLTTSDYCLPVLGEDKKLLGIVTRRDLVRTMLAKATQPTGELPGLYLSALEGDRKSGVVNTGKS